jgi:hypothetical protein
MTIWTFQALLTRRLMQWSMISAGLSLPMVFGNKYQRAMGSQFFGWAAVNMAIAFVGTQGRLKAQTQPDANTPARRQKEAKNLKRLLLINAALDVVYMVFGLLLFTRRKGKAGTRGTGAGIFLQGAFLFGFDLYHAAEVPDLPTEPS